MVFKRTKGKTSDSQSSSAASRMDTKESAHAQHLSSSLHSDKTPLSTFSTCQSGSYKTCKTRQSVQKSVSFHQVQIREYERSLGDNPSCSSGAPIGIGWGFQKAFVMGVEEYERNHKRGRTQDEIILTRKEREQLLREWCTPDKDIAQSTRENLKVKFQRRRSVRNSRKMEKLHSTIGGIKKVLGIRRRKSDEPHVVPDLPGSERSDSSDGHVQISEPEDGESDDGLEDLIDDAVTAVSGITFGDSTTSSAYELEMFHRELELEMFGEGPDELDEPSNILGHTLELADNIPPPESNTMSVGSGSLEDQMSSSSSTYHSFQSPNYTYNQDPNSCYNHNTHQMDLSPVNMEYATIQEQLVQQQHYPQTHHVQYNPYARTSAYRGYSLRDAYRGSNKFSAFDVANQQFPATPFPQMGSYHHGQQHEQQCSELPMQSRYTAAPDMVPPSPPGYPSDHVRNNYDYSDLVQQVRYTSDDSRTGIASDVQSWEEIYYDDNSAKGQQGSFEDSTQSMTVSNHSMNYMSYGSPRSFTHKPLSAAVAVDLSVRTQHA